MSEDAPHTDRIFWYITLTLIQLADTVYKKNFKALVTFLAESYNTNIRASKGHNHVWWELLLFLGLWGEDENVLGIFDHYLIDDSGEFAESMENEGEADRTWA